MKRLRIFPRLICLFAFVDTGLKADVTWAKPETTAVTPGAVLWIDLTSAAEFGTPTSPVAKADVQEFAVHLNGQPVSTGATVVGGGMLRFSVVLPRPGVAVAAARLNPESREIPRERVERYLWQMHASDEIRARWSEKQASWREVRRLKLKTFVRVGEPAKEDRSWATPVNGELDLVVDFDPSVVRENDSFAVRLVRGGEPVVGAVVAFVSAGEAREHVLTTDGEGRASACLDARGAWLIRGIDLRGVEAADHEWETDIVALTIHVP